MEKLCVTMYICMVRIEYIKVFARRLFEKKLRHGRWEGFGLMAELGGG